jgi:hypothetical protein
MENNEEVFKLTEWFILYTVLTEYGIDVSHISGRVGQHIVEDFIAGMIEQGYILKASDLIGEE